MGIYTKEEIQKRVLHNGEMINIIDFTWDEKTKTFSSALNNLFLDFNGVSSCNFKTGRSCTFKTSYYCTFDTGSYCTFETGRSCTFKTDYYCTFKTDGYCTFKTCHSCIFNTGNACTFDTGNSCAFNTGDSCTFDTGGCCTFETSYYCTFKTGGSCTFNTGGSCTFNTGWHGTFNTGDYCIFKTDSYCAFKTGSSCTFKTGGRCTFNTCGYCTFNTDSSCAFNTGSSCTFNIYDIGYFLSNKTDCVYIIRNDNGMKIYTNDGVEDNMITKLSIDSIDVKPLRGTVMIDNIQIIDSSIMVIKSKRQISDFNIFTAYYIDDYFKDDSKHIIVAQKEIEGILYNAHGETIKQAMRDVMFKYMSSQDVQVHVKRVKEVGIVTALDYRLLTGSCEAGTRKFCTDNGIDYDTIELSIDESIELTKDANMGDRFRELLT